MNENQEAYCTCPSIEKHPCPYASDVFGDDSDEEMCNCCESCTKDCAEDI